MESTPKQETVKLEGSEKWPIGMTYNQWKEKKSPAKLFGGTWEKTRPFPAASQVWEKTAN